MEAAEYLEKIRATTKTADAWVDEFERTEGTLQSSSGDDVLRDIQQNWEDMMAQGGSDLDWLSPENIVFQHFRVSQIILDDAFERLMVFFLLRTISLHRTIRCCRILRLLRKA